MIDRNHPIYQTICQLIIENDDKPVGDVYKRHAKLYGVYDQALYDTAIRLGKRLKESFDDTAFVNMASERMLSLPVVYNLIACKQVPTKKLSKVIENKSFRPIAEELMEVIFGV